MSEVGQDMKVYSCEWRQVGKDFVANIIGVPEIVGHGSSVKKAIDDLYLKAINAFEAQEIVFELCQESADSDAFVAIGSNELVKLEGDASELYELNICDRCSMFSKRNYATTLKVSSVPKSSVCRIRRRGIDIYEKSIGNCLEIYGLQFIAHPVLGNGGIIDYIELEPRKRLSMPVPKRAVAVPGATWRCSVCGYWVKTLRDAITGITPSVYVRRSDLKNAGVGLFIDDELGKSILILRKWLADELRKEGLFKGVVTKDVIVVDDDEVVQDFEFSDFPV